VVVHFCVYTQHFPTFEEQRDELGRQVRDGDHDDHQGANPGAAAARRQAAGGNPLQQQAARAQRPVSLIEAFVRRIVEVSPIAIRIDPGRGRQRLDDGGVVQQALDAVMAEACQDPTVWRALSGNAVVPVQALDTSENYAQYIRTIATGAVLLPPLHASLDIRITPMRDGRVRVRCYFCNNTARDTVQRFRDQHNILADCQVQGILVRGRLSPVELLPVPRDYQFDRDVWAIGHGASVVVSDDHRSVRTEALARYRQPRRTTKERPAALFTPQPTATRMTSPGQ
jgi:hypothetical protein